MICGVDALHRPCNKSARTESSLKEEGRLSHALCGRITIEREKKVPRWSSEVPSRWPWIIPDAFPASPYERGAQPSIEMGMDTV